MGNNNSLDLSMIPKELVILLEIITMDNEDGIESFNDELLNDINWDLFLRLAMYHRVYPILYSKLKKINKALVPPHVFQTLYQEYKKICFKCLN
ncbi:nucleotidyltransferase family protein [Peribacillus frigoritolerans]|nr:nucleotidyltransferase family protein [Peribacillus frigoritolerans]